jgi:predicted house-cleaning noncanonical NTP pyrophosphatase (MazG superfamily)
MKLVRNQIPEIIEESGKSCTHHLADLLELKSRLYEKMHEELDEFVEVPSLEEAADMYEVLRTIVWVHNMSMEDVIMTAESKRQKRGGFSDGVILERVFDEV